MDPDEAERRRKHGSNISTGGPPRILTPDLVCYRCSDPAGRTFRLRRRISGSPSAHSAGSGSGNSADYRTANAHHSRGTAFGQGPGCLTPPATRADLRGMVQGSNNFAFDLYRAQSDGEGNLFYSPFSISQTLAMTFAGAKGETERQMARTLQYRLSQGSLHPAFNALDQELASRGKAPRGTPNQGEANQYLRLNIANGI